jgi:hypothetical protein
MVETITGDAGNGNTKNLFTGAQEAPTVDGVRNPATATAPNDNQDKIAEMQRVLLFRIAALKASAGLPMPQAIADQIDSMESAIATGNLTVLSLAYIATVAAKGSIEGTQAQISARNAIAMEEISSLLPDFGQYSREAQAQIVKFLDGARKNSSLLNETLSAVEKLQPEERAFGREQIAQNYKLLREIKNDPEKAALFGPEAIQMMETYGAARHPDFAEKMRKAIETGDASEAKRLAAGLAADQANRASKVGPQVMSGMSDESRQALGDEFGKGADFNGSKFITEYAKIGMRERDAVLMKKEKGEQLTPAEERALRITLVGLAVEADQTGRAVVELVKNKALVAELTRGGDVNERAEKLEAFMREKGMITRNAQAVDKLAEEIIKAVDGDPAAKKLFEEGKIDELYGLMAKKAGVANREELMTQFLIAATKEDALTDDKSGRPLSAEEAQARREQWQAIEQAKMLEANGVTPEAIAAHAASQGKEKSPEALAAERVQAEIDKADIDKTLQKVLAAQAARGNNGAYVVAAVDTAAMLDTTPQAQANQSEPAAQAATSTAAQPTSSAVVTTAVVAPPGVDQEMLKKAGIGFPPGVQFSEKNGYQPSGTDVPAPVVRNEIAPNQAGLSTTAF